jgi:two-component system phosphate regulon sensor histidine kinase PhoR
MQKNYSPKTIAFFCAIATFALVFLANYFIFSNLVKSLLVALLIFGVVYSMVWYYIQEVLDKKVKTIYKFINQTKAGKKELFYQDNLLPRPSLQDVSKDVEEWANKNTAEFALLEKNEQYRKEFLQNLSHELKTPLFSMQGYVESLLNGALHDPAVNEKFVKNTANNIDRLLDLVQDLDAITKLESDQAPLQLSTFSINDLINDTFNATLLKAKEKNIHLQFKQGSLQNKKVTADKAKIAQVLTNLIENAIKYGKENGNVIANIDKLSGDNILIEITDDGYGIAEEQLDRIFERFYRTDLARSRKVGGSGLGLAICKHIIEAHQQTIHVRSNINVGTTFRFTLNGA